MIKINDSLNLKNSLFNATFLDSKYNIVFNSFKEESFELNTNESVILNVENKDSSSVELYQKIIGYNLDIKIEINGNIEGYFRHIILLNNVCKSLEFINNINVKNGGNYELIIIDLMESNNNMTNNIKVIDVNTKASILCASVVNKEYIKIINNNTTNSTSNTIANMDNYGVSFDSGKLKIRGIGSIEKGCYKSVNEQKDTMFVLDENSKVSCEPFLFIDEDDVVASHANALGQIDSEALFYLCSRGIKMEVAKKMVVLGYFKKFVETVNDIDIKNDLYKSIEEVTKNV